MSESQNAVKGESGEHMVRGEAGYKEAESREKALERGWKPPEKWVGPTDNYVDHEEYNRRWEQRMPNVLNELDESIAENKKLSARLKGIEGFIEELTQNQREGLEQEFEYAVSVGDVEAAKKIQSRLQQPKADNREAEAKRLLKEFEVSNADWYRGTTERDKRATRYANGLAADIIAEQYNGDVVAANSDPAFFKRIEHETRQLLSPEQIDEDTNRRRSGAVSGAGSQSSSGRRRAASNDSFSNLNSEYKQAFEYYYNKGTVKELSEKVGREEAEKNWAAKQKNNADAWEQ